jgi:hypothetical protein
VFVVFNYGPSKVELIKLREEKPPARVELFIARLHSIGAPILYSRGCALLLIITCSIVSCFFFNGWDHVPSVIIMRINHRKFGGSELSKMKREETYSSGMVVGLIVLELFAVSYLDSGSFKLVMGGVRSR